MVRSLSDIDPIYRETISKLPKVDRLYHCNQLIDKYQYILEKNRRILDKKQKDQLRETIVLVQREVNTLTAETPS